MHSALGQRCPPPTVKLESKSMQWTKTGLTSQWMKSNTQGRKHSPTASQNTIEMFSLHQIQSQGLIKYSLERARQFSFLVKGTWGIDL